MRTRLLNLLLLGGLALALTRLWLFLSQPPPSLPVIDAGPPPSVSAAAQARVGGGRKGNRGDGTRSV